MPDADPTRTTLFTDVQVFDGTSSALRDGLKVLVEDGTIVSVASGDLAAPEGADVIECGGRTLMPGLIDAHWHSMLAAMPISVLMTADVGFIHLTASAEAERTLLRGFTTVRDLGGPAFPLKKAIDLGLATGPRIYPSGAMISQTSGHADFRSLHELPRTAASLSRAEVIGASAIADSPDDVRRRTREQLMAGASQIKLTAGGGVASYYDPLDTTQFRPEEIRAAVEAAEDWGTYVTAHVYTPTGIKRCIEAGVRCIDHGHLTDEEGVRMMADEGVRWSLQPFTKEADANINPAETARLAKKELVTAGTDRSYELAIKYGVTPAWGTDILFDPNVTSRQGTFLATMRRWYTPAQALNMATSGNADLLAMSGPRDPYPGKLGVIEEGALADLLVVEGDPLTDLDLVADPENNFKVIMKGGKTHKNTL